MRMLSVVGWGLALTLAANCSVQAQAPADQRPGWLITLERIERGEFESEALPAPSPDAIDRFYWDLRRRGGGWIDAEGPAARDRRRRVAVLAALEIAAQTWKHAAAWEAGRKLVEWGCAEVRRGPRDEFQRVWLLASVALIHGAGDELFLSGRPASFVTDPLYPSEHAAHVRQQFPGEARFALASLLVDLEARTLANRPGLPPLVANARNPPRDARVRKLVTAFRDHADDASVGGEAALRAAILLFRLKDLEASLTFAKRAAQRAGADPMVIYLAHLFTGLALESLDRSDEARQEYEAALRVVPRAKSGVMLLAQRLFRSDQRDEASRLLDEALAGSPAADPWSAYAFGDFRFWPVYREVLRREVRR